MIANTINGRIKTFNAIPKVFELKPNIMGYNKLDSSVHYADGFREIVVPTLEENQYKTDLYFDAENNSYTYEVETHTEEELNENEKLQEQNRYLQRIEAGKNRFSKLAADFRVDKLNGVITHEFHRLLEDTLKPVRDEFVNGQFISSLEILESIGGSEITIEIYDNIHASITEAIQEHYS